MRVRYWFLAGLLVHAHFSITEANHQPAKRTILRQGLVVDGSGRPGRVADLLIEGDQISVVQPTLDAKPGDRVIDASGLVVAPGFIDLHTHSDEALQVSPTRDNLNYLKQGVTTVVTGNCGMGPTDVKKYFQTLRRGGVGSNVIHLIPHGSLRKIVLGNGDRQPNPDELQRMRTLVQRGMDEGAWGMSTGLIYLPGRYAKTDELVELSKIVAQSGGFYASHIRDEGSGLIASIDEAVEIGRRSGAAIHISHLKASGRSNWGKIQEACARIVEARKQGLKVTADQYPYVASSTRLEAMVIPDWARQGTTEDFRAIAADPRQGRRLREAIEAALRQRDGGASVRIARFAPRPDWVGLDLKAIAEKEKTTPLDIVIAIQSQGGAAAISFGMSEEDVRFAMKQPFVATASDGGSHRPGGQDKPHPRAYGTFPRKFRYALDDKLMSLEEAVRVSSALPAEILGLARRGRLEAGTFADLVVFDPKTFRDAATFDNSTVYAPGVEYLFVNGVAAIDGGRPTGQLAGRVLEPTKDGAADLILKVGKIWTGDPKRPWAEAIAIRAGVIVAVGDSREIESHRGSSTRLIEHPHAFATPGLIDAHGHMTSLGSVLDEIDLRDVKSREEIAQLVKQKAAKVPGESWILGQNWDQSLWADNAFPTREVLDVVAPDRPVWLTRVDGHAGWANSFAMRLAKVDQASKAPSDGQIVVDREGKPTGVFVDGAMGLITRAIPPSTTEQIEARLLAAQKMVLESGLTCVHDAGVSAREALVYRDLERRGLLKVRVYAMASPPSHREVEFVSKPPLAAAPADRFQMRAIKLFMDGAMGSRGGLLFAPYADDPKNSGLSLIEPEVLRATTEMALRQGWQVCTHAIGDRANALVLEAYEKAREKVPSARDPRLRVEHAQVVRRQDVARFRQAGVIASMQPSHACTDMRWADARLGPERVAGAYAWAWFAQEKVALAFGSDFPVEVTSPFWGIYAGLYRQDRQGKPEGGWHPDQRLSLDQVLSGFTRGAAYAMFAEDRLGTIVPGYRADLSVIDRDLSNSSPSQILDAKVLTTIIDGEVVFEGVGKTSQR